MDNINCALIMAGGKGTRFWPKSTEDKPKQFLKLVGNNTMIQETFKRITKRIPVTQVFVVTCEKYKSMVMEQLKKLPEENIILEPEGRNTAPCILLACLYIKQMYENATISVFPSDHTILEQKKFLEIVDTANTYVESNRNSIVTIGITPTRPETGFGYIKCSEEKVKMSNGINVINVEKFVEKPDLETAKKYLIEGKYLWNAGMFIFDNNFMLNEIKKSLPAEYTMLSKLPSIKSDKYYEELKKIYEKCQNISIDYAVMEKSNSIRVIPADISWDDIGTWLALKRYIVPDGENNYIKGDVEIINASNNVIYAENKKIILMGLDDVFCIDSDDTIIIGRTSDLNKVHELGKRKKNK